ncbi:heavy-metal-associated domain-containing protein [Micromonospora yasonensis]|uniref:heavy-metal-associated domain-containing protein n=1 Tax=Micromonospora yasonensis TaxID=1128667 RepID=UPI0029F50875|nr:heavy-metal-associated domain-containing protein [Micromonospora yasonensis]
MCTNGSSCGCATATDNPPTVAATGEGARSTYTVSGMTCGGCAKKVTGHVSEIAGVTDVQADVASGTIAVVSETPLQTADVREAVERAGYRLVG